MKVAAVRETFDETSNLLARSRRDGPVRPVRDVPFRDMLRRSGFVIDLDDVQLFSRWVTPEGAPQRFDTSSSSRRRHPVTTLFPMVMRSRALNGYAPMNLFGVLVIGSGR